MPLLRFQLSLPMAKKTIASTHNPLSKVMVVKKVKGRLLLAIASDRWLVQPRVSHEIGCSHVRRFPRARRDPHGGRTTQRSQCRVFQIPHQARMNPLFLL